MSYYEQEKTLRDWALNGGLARHLPEDSYAVLYARIRDRRGRNRITRIGIAMLKIFFERENGAPGDSPRASMSLAVPKEEIASLLRCSASQVRKQANRINAAVAQGAAENTYARRYGLIWRNEFGIGVHLGFGDAESARRMGTVQKTTVTRSWDNNTNVVEEAEQEKKILEDQLRKFEAMSPADRARVLKNAAG